MHEKNLSHRFIRCRVDIPEGLPTRHENLRPTPRMHHPREILNAIFYIVRGGCAWRLLPHDFPPWSTVYHYFRAWRLDSTWERKERGYDGGKKIKGDQGQKAPPFGGYTRLDAQGEGPWCGHHGPRWDQAAAGACEGSVPTPFSSVVGRGLQRQEQRVDREGLRLDGGSSAASAEDGSARGDEGMGQGVGQ